MELSSAQKATFKADIIARQANGQPLNGVTDEQLIANYYNAASSKVAWRTNVTRAEIYHQISGESTTWSWTTYKAQSVPEQNAWVQMFMGDIADFSLDNLRAGVVAIFGNSGAGGLQKDHVLAVGKRTATRLEALFIGDGTLAAPVKFVTQGQVTAQEVANVVAGV